MQQFSLILNGKKYKGSKFDLLVGQLKFQNFIIHIKRKILFEQKAKMCLLSRKLLPTKHNDFKVSDVIDID